MKIDPFLSDEPTLAPATPGAALVRLSHVLGALQNNDTANVVPNAEIVPKWREVMLSTRSDLLSALENRNGVEAAFHASHSRIREFYSELKEGAGTEGQARVLAAFGFPDPTRSVDDWVHPVDTSSVILTHFMPERQVFTTIAFDEAPGATAYWLWEVRFFDNERLEDAVVENYAPQFSRVRLPVGPHRLFIESRNPHRSVRSQEFEVEIPQL